MYSHIPLLVLVFVVLIVYCSAGIAAPPSLIYKCYPNATLQIQNPNTYQGAFANNSGTICNTTFKNNNIFLFVTGCNMDIPISVTFSNYSEIDNGLLGGKAVVDAYLITCLQIPESGVFWNVSAMLDVELEKHNQSAEYPEYGLTSDILMMDYLTGTLYLVDSAYIGDELTWFMTIDAENHDIKPEKCIAYAGRNMSAMTNSTSQKVITVMGCSTDYDLTEDFQLLSNFVYAKLKAFRFFESAFITIECDVRVCPINSTACAIVCPTTRRKRDIQFQDLVLDKFDPNVFQVRSVFRVAINSATSDYLCGWTIILVVWLYLVKSIWKFDGTYLLIP